MKLRAICYLRVSTEDQAEFGTGLDVQENACLEAAERIGAEVVNIVSDPGVSGTIYPRPGLEAALIALETGRADVLIAYNASRIGRRVSVCSTALDRIQAAGARLHLHEGGEVTEDSELLFTIFSGFAQQDHRQILKRMGAGRRRRAEKGVQVFRSSDPFGLHVVTNSESQFTGVPAGTYLLVEQEAPIVQEIFARWLNGESMHEIARGLQARNIPTPKAQRRKDAGVPSPSIERGWLHSAIRRILANPVYMGEAVAYKTRRHYVTDPSAPMGRKRSRETRTTESEQVRIPVDCALVSPETWEKAQERLQGIQRGQGGGRPDRRHIFTGIMTCHLCERKMSGYISRRKMALASGIEKEYSRTCYRCQDASKSRNSAGTVCFPTPQGEQHIKAALAALAVLLEDEPTFLTLAIAAYRQRKMSGYSVEDHAAVINELRDLESRERAAAEAYVDAVRLGARKETFEAILADLATKRRALETRKSSIESGLMQARAQEPESVEGIARQYAEDLLEIITSESLKPNEANAVLSRLITDIRPTEGGYEVRLTPFFDDREAETRAYITTDGSHPNDLGMMRYAEALRPVLAKIRTR